MAIRFLTEVNVDSNDVWNGWCMMYQLKYFCCHYIYKKQVKELDG